MSVNQQVSGIIATFANRRHAEHFVNELKRAGFEDNEIGVLSGHNKAADIEEDAAAGAIGGGMVGAVAGAMATMMVPGVGPLIAGGLLAGIVGGTAVGAATGGVLGALVGLGVSEKKARQHEQELRSGRSLVVVQAVGRGGEALAILRRCEGDLAPVVPPTLMAKRSFLKKLWRGRTSADYCTEGEVCLAKGDYPEAISDFTKAIRLEPKNVGGYLDRGLAYAEEGEYPEAISDYDIALRLDPHHAYTYLHRGGAYFALDNFDQAIHDYTEAIRLDPNLALAYYYRGLAYLEKGETAQAEADEATALRLLADPVSGVLCR